MAETNIGHPSTQHCYPLYLRCTENLTRSFRDVDWCEETCKELHNRCPRDSRDCPAELEFPTIVLVIFILIALFSFLANGFVCVVYTLSNEIRTAKHYFMVNLVIADILIAVFGIPFYLTVFIQHKSKTLCQIGAMVDVLCCTSSIIGFTVISAERFVAVKYPLRHQTIVSRRRCLLVLSFMWVYSIAFSLASRIPVGKFDKGKCIFFTDAYIIFTTFASFVIPLFAMLALYGWIYKVAAYQARQINSYHGPRSTNRIQREVKAAKTLTLIIGAFVVSWLPFFCYIWIFTLFKVKAPPHLHHIMQIARYLNGLANPFLYVGVNREFRRSTFKFLKRILPHKERRASGSTNEYTQTTEIAVRKISEASTSSPCCT
mgnify:CR=1 FL=1